MTIFAGSRTDPHLTACVNYWHESLEATATSYLRATNVMLQHVLETGRDLDMLALPILYNWRHYLELRFKTFALDAALIEDTSTALQKSHDLALLWSRARSRLVALFPDEDHEGELAIVDAHVKELARLDPHAATFRYTVKVDHTPLLPPELQHLAYPELAHLVREASLVLEGASVMLGQARQYVAERNREANDYHY